MNILWFLAKDFDVALDVSARLATIRHLEKNHDLTIVTSYRREKRYDYKIRSRLVYLTRGKFPLLKTWHLYKQILDFFKKGIDLDLVDVVYLNSKNYFLLKKLSKLRKTHGFKLVFDIRTLPVDPSPLKKRISEILFRKNLRLAAEKFDGLTYITDEMRRYCKTRYHLPEHRSEVWSSGVDLDVFKPSDSPRQNGKFRLIYHGVINRNRGIGTIVRAMEKIKEREIEVFLMGGGEGVLEVKELIRHFRLEERVVFHPPVPHHEVPRYINEADAGILPFPLWPGWNVSSPIKLFEYLACGKPVVVTKIPAHTDVLDGRDFAFWAENSTADDIARAISEAYKNKNNFDDLGTQAREFVKMNHSWERQLSKLDRFLESLS
jgi:glycosyltransferase involved in cell wall biosynthesis